MTQLSPSFSLAEMTASQVAARHGYDNTPGMPIIASLTTLCVAVLEPLRGHYGRPVRISSGYRAPAVNRAIGGAASSQHVRGEAADLTVPGVANIDVAQWIMGNLKYDQLIYEFGQWVHVSYGPRMRMQELTARHQDGGTVYLRGLHA